MAKRCTGDACACGPAGRGLYSATKAVERELGDFGWAAYRVGDDLQRALVDGAYDAASGALGQLATRVSDVAARIVESAQRLQTPNAVALAVEQARNNVEVFTLVRNIRTRLGLDPSEDIDLARDVQSAYGLGAYADLWAIEGLGHDYTVLRLDCGDETAIMVDGPATALPASTLTMMHAGLGLAFAERVLPALAPCDDAGRFRAVLSRYVSLCDANSRPGYRGAAYESLGLVARMWHPQLVAPIDAALMRMDEGLAAYFWHGVGRALYFLPAYIIPLLSPWCSIDREAPHDLGRSNLTAGLAWAWTLVNVRQPPIMRELIRTRGDRLARSDAFANGVASAVVMASDITPDDPYIVAFASIDADPRADGGAAWQHLVHGPAQAALKTYGPVLRRYQALDQVFRYTDLPALVARLANSS